MSGNKDKQEVLSQAASGASFLLLGTILQRLLTFAMNTALIRYTHADVLGFAGHDMELLLSSILFLAREGVRLTALRNDFKVASIETQSLVNLSWCVLPIGFLLALAASAVFGSQAESSEELLTVLIFAAAAVLECAIEPMYIVVMGTLQMSVRVRAEGAAAFAKTVITTLCVMQLQLAAPAFAIGQALYAAVLVAVYMWWAHTGDAIVRLTPAWLAPGKKTDDTAAHVEDSASLGSFILWKHLRLGGSFAGQGALKHVLSEGDRMLLSAGASRADKGAYNVVSSLGSLAPRLLFQPIEDASRNLFGILAHSANKQQRMRNSKESPEAWLALCLTLRSVALVGMVFMFLGPPFTQVLVKLLLSKEWAATVVPSALAVFCVYVATMAVNGITEAFVFAVVNEADLLRLNARLMGISALYAALAWTGLRTYGVPGLLAAASANMVMRSANSMWFIKAYFFKQHAFRVRWSQALPSVFTILTAVGAGALCHGMGLYWGLHPLSDAPRFASHAALVQAFYVFVGAIAGVVVLGAVYAHEAQHLRNAVDLLRAAKKSDRGALSKHMDNVKVE